MGQAERSACRWSKRAEKVQTASRSGKTIDGAKAVRFEYGTATDFEVLLQGVDRIFLLLPTGFPDVVGTLSPLIEAAAGKKVKMVYQSALGADIHEDHDHHKVERILKSSGTPYVSLRPNWFSDDFHTFWKSDVLKGDIRCDLFDGRGFELTGPQALSYAEAAEILSAATGKVITYTPLSGDEYVKLRTSEGDPPEFARTIADIFAPVREGEMAPVTNGVFELTGRFPRTLAVYARDHAADLVK